MSYRATRALLRVALDGFFRRVVVEGLERIPEGGPALLVSNHTNAFVDPLLILTRVHRRITLTAKATLRRNPLLAPVIRGLGVLLVHRRQDAGEGPREGARTTTGGARGLVTANEPVLEQAAAILARGGAVYVFPEGQSHSDPGMRPFHTGAARIALRFLELEPDGDLPIVPLGLHFERKSAWRSRAIALVGEPRSVRAWRDAHPDAGPRELTAAMDAWVRELTVNTESERDRRLVTGAAALLVAGEAPPEALDRPEPVRTAEEVASVHRLQDGAAWLREHRPDRYETLRRRVESHVRRLEALGVTPGEVNLPMSPWRAALFTVRELELALVGLPVVAWGWLNHLPALATVKRAVRALSKDEDHWASNAVFISIPVFAVFYLLQLVLADWLLPAGWAAVYAAALPFAGAVALLWRDRAGSAARRVRTFFLFLRRPDLRAGLAAESRALIAEMRAIEKEIPRS